MIMMNNNYLEVLVNRQDDYYQATGAAGTVANRATVLGRATANVRATQKIRQCKALIAPYVYVNKGHSARFLVKLPRLIFKAPLRAGNAPVFAHTASELLLVFCSPYC